MTGRWQNPRYNPMMSYTQAKIRNKFMLLDIVDITNDPRHNS